MYYLLLYYAGVKHTPFRIAQQSISRLLQHHLLSQVCPSREISKVCSTKVGLLILMN